MKYIKTKGGLSMQKNSYNKLEIAVIKFEMLDVLCASGDTLVEDDDIFFCSVMEKSFSK